MNRKQYGFTPGVASLIMVLITLAMVVFSTLYLVQAKSNLKITERQFDNSTEFYNADKQGMMVYYQINEELSAFNDIERASIDFETFGLEIESGIIRYTINIDEMQYLSVELAIKENDQGRYAEIIKWQKKIRNEADYDNHDFDF